MNRLDFEANTIEHLLVLGSARTTLPKALKEHNACPTEDSLREINNHFFRFCESLAVVGAAQEGLLSGARREIAQANAFKIKFLHQITRAAAALLKQNLKQSANGINSQVQRRDTLARLRTLAEQCYVPRSDPLIIAAEEQIRRIGGPAEQAEGGGAAAMNVQTVGATRDGNVEVQTDRIVAANGEKFTEIPGVWHATHIHRRATKV
eukprot:INCI188.1.p1 GENE.INCI188.1~~INCI188.1.p1  ORF type:complete len:207 (-),score=42.10 INCI188.1:254-874(-)